MHTALVIIHVISMIVSMSLMTGAVGMGLFGKNSAANVATAGFATAITGFISGAVLLFGATLSLECAMLAGYLVAVTMLYHFGFAFGDATKARLIRQS